MNAEQTRSLDRPTEPERPERGWRGVTTSVLIVGLASLVPAGIATALAAAATTLVSRGRHRHDIR